MLYDVLFANGEFVAVGSLGAICVSANGTDWSAVSSGVATTLTGVAYGNGTYVAVGSSGTVLTSTNSLSWTKQGGISTSLALQSITYGNNLFLAITGAGEIIQSPDGMTWTSQPAQGGNPSKVTFVNNRFVIVDYGMKLSADGTNWASPNYVYPVLTNLIYAGGYYVGVGSGVGSGNGGSILYSQNLTNWTTAINDASSYGLSAVAYGNGTFVAAGMHGLIRTSTDHLNWPIRKQSLTYLGNLYGIKYINNEFVAGGTGGVSPGGYGEYSPLLFSGPPGGNNWYARPSGVFSAIWDLACGQGRYVVVNASGLTTSTNGSNWTSVSSGLSSQLAGLTFANNLFVLTAWGGGISTSPDGLTWTARTSGSTRNLWGVAYGNGLWVAVGQAFSSTGAYITSGDGLNWTNHSFSPNLRNIAFGGGTFVIVGDSGYLASSTTGLSWTQRGSGTSGAIYGVCYGDTNFVAVGTSGYMASSSDGASWTLRNSGTTTTLERVAYGGGTFVATGDGGLLIQSASTLPSLVSKNVAGGIELDLVGGFDRSYVLEATTNLNALGWSPLTTLSSGQRQFTDTDKSPPHKFYHLKLP